MGEFIVVTGTDSMYRVSEDLKECRRIKGSKFSDIEALPVYGFLPRNLPRNTKLTMENMKKFCKPAESTYFIQSYKIVLRKHPIKDEFTITSPIVRIFKQIT